MNQWLEMVIKLPYVSSKCWLTVSGFTYLQVVPSFSGARQVQTSSISKAMEIQVVEFHVQGYHIQWDINEWQKSTLQYSIRTKFVALKRNLSSKTKKKLSNFLLKVFSNLFSANFNVNDRCYNVKKNRKIKIFLMETFTN